MHSPWGWKSSCPRAPEGLDGGMDGAVLRLGTNGTVLWLGAVDGVGRCSDVGWWTAWFSALARGGAPAARGEGLTWG